MPAPGSKINPDCNKTSGPRSAAVDGRGKENPTPSSSPRRSSLRPRRYEQDAGAGVGREIPHAGVKATTQRLRLAAEGSRFRELASGGLLTPTLEVDPRQDGGDGATGFGVEAGRGVGPARLGPGADERDLSSQLPPSWGESESGMAPLGNEDAVVGVAGDRGNGASPASARTLARAPPTRLPGWPSLKMANAGPAFDLDFEADHGENPTRRDVLWARLGRASTRHRGGLPISHNRATIACRLPERLGSNCMPLVPTGCSMFRSSGWENDRTKSAPRHRL